MSIPDSMKLDTNSGNDRSLTTKCGLESQIVAQTNFKKEIVTSHSPENLSLHREKYGDVEGSSILRKDDSLNIYPLQSSLTKERSVSLGGYFVSENLFANQLVSELETKKNTKTENFPGLAEQVSMESFTQGVYNLQNRGCHSTFGIGEPEENTGHIDKPKLLSRTPPTKKRCHYCLQSIYGVGFCEKRQKLGKVNILCQKCGKHLCKNHYVTICENCYFQ